MPVRDNILYYGRSELASQITPKVQVQDDIVSPHAEWVPAPWLPVAFVKNDHDRGQAWIVISAGKVVALERSPYGESGRRPHVVPAGMAISLKPSALITETVLTYTSNDVLAQTQDLVTGSTVTAATSYTAEEVCDALLRRGLVSAKEVVAAGGTVPVTAVAHCEDVIDAFISEAIGYTVYDVHAYAGFAEEGDQRITNWREQAAISIWTEGQLRLPQLAAQEVAEGFDLDAVLPAVGAAAAGDAPLAGEVWDATALAGLERYSAVLDGSEDIYGFVLSAEQLAMVTDRTPAPTSTPAAVLVEQLGGPEDLSAAGEFAIDYDAGILFVNATQVDALPTDAAAGDDITFTYWAYDNASSVHPRYALFAGSCRPGDFLTFDADSNFTSSGRTPSGAFLGRVDDFEVWPKHLQQFRKTAWEINATGFGATSRITGSATKGFPDAFTLPEDQSNIVADRFVIVHVRI